LNIYKRLYRFYGPQGWWPARTRFEIMIGAILTQNTAWANVEKAIVNLRRHGLISSPRAMKDVNERKLAGMIRPAGYYNVKARRVKNFVNFLFSGYSGSLAGISRRETPRLREELLAVNGVGPETCDSILLYAFRRPIFVVDAYTKRIFSRHSFFAASATYEKVQKFFMAHLPKDERLFNEYHALIVRVGKDFCRTRPKCGPCPLRGIKIT